MPQKLDHHLGAALARGADELVVDAGQVSGQGLVVGECRSRSARGSVSRRRRRRGWTLKGNDVAECVVVAGFGINIDDLKREFDSYLQD
jgi:hypothetical protein